MQQEPTPAIHMKKQLGWVHKLGQAESLGISKVGQSVLARLMESQIQHQLASSVGEGVRKGTMASVRFDARHLNLSQHVTVTFQAAIPALELRGNESK